MRESRTTEWKEFDEQKNDDMTNESLTDSMTESELPKKSTAESENRL